MTKQTIKGRLFLSVLPQEWHAVRPRDCEDGDEPCPWRECPYAIDNPAHPEVTCAIDVADEGPSTVTEIGRILGVSHVMVLKIEKRAKRKLSAKGLQAVSNY